jgi:nucleoside triphosphate pyrophosphatase
LTSPLELRFVLASTSAARRSLLAIAGIDPMVEPSHVDEAAIVRDTPEALVQALADAKAESVAARVGHGLVLGCDTLLFVDGRALGKPANAEEARSFWSLFAGRTATLLTGHALLKVEQGVLVARASAVGRTDIHFGRPTPAQVAAYVASGEPLASSGAFTLSGLSAPFIEGISGAPSNVQGLSLPLLRALLAELGVSIEQLWRAR